MSKKKKSSVVPQPVSTSVPPSAKLPITKSTTTYEPLYPFVEVD